MFGFIFAFLSALFLTAMVLTDKFLIHRCYENNKFSAWFVSSVFGSVLGLLLTFLLWIVLSIINEIGTLRMIWDASIELLLWDGILILISGVFAVQVLYHYFSSFSEDAPVGTIAGWIAATPLFIFIATIGLIQVSQYSELINYEKSNFGLIFFIGFVLAISGLILFEKQAGDSQYISNGKTYRKHIALLIVFSVFYSLTIEYVLQKSHPIFSNEMKLIALLPYFWIGFGYGITVLLNRTNRALVTYQWRKTIRRYLPIIITVEIIGMLVFYFEYLGLSQSSATYVSLIIGGHVIFVYLFDKLIEKEKMKLHEVFFIFVATVGIILTTYSLL